MQTQEVTPTICPKCQTRYHAPTISLIDVSSEPSLKEVFLQGQLNTSRCPQCGFAHPVDVPILYHDGEKELALIFIPHSMTIAHTDEQKIIGALSNRLMDSLPPEKRKGYLFTPKTFITLESLVKAVLAADGITEEMLEAQDAKLKLLDALLKTQNENELNHLIQDNLSQLDYQFFEIITAFAVQALQAGDQNNGQHLLAFRQFVAQATEHGQAYVTQIDEKIGLQSFSPEKLLSALKNASSEEEFVALVGSGRSLLDYTFFQNLTAEINAASATGNTTEAEKLKALRTRILETSARVDKETREMLNNTHQLMQNLVDAPNPQQFVQNNLAKFDEMFFTILIANIQEAQKAGQMETVQKLSNLYKLVMDTLQEQLPPEVQLLNKLVGAQTPQAIAALLAENKTLITPEFVAMVERMEAEVQSQGQPEISAALAEIKKQAQAITKGDAPAVAGLF